MDFGYFTLSDNHYLNNRRTANQFVQDILAEAVHADELGMHVLEQTLEQSALLLGHLAKWRADVLVFTGFDDHALKPDV